jgi:hypothetical protein
MRKPDESDAAELHLVARELRQFSQHSMLGRSRAEVASSAPRQGARRADYGVRRLWHSSAIRRLLVGGRHRIFATEPSHVRRRRRVGVWSLRVA